MDAMEFLELAWALTVGGGFGGAVISKVNAWEFDHNPHAQPFEAPRWRLRARLFGVLTTATAPLAFLLPWRS